MSSETIPNADSGAASPAPADDAIRQERDELRERLLRTAADFDNYRKRTDRERREQAEYASADLVRDLLPVIDDLERALAAAGTGDDPQLAALRRGVFLDVLARRGVEPIETVGQQFDPVWHEALATEPAEGRAEDEITAEIRRGYRMGQRLLRAALVKVARS
jgi:molecular chaperone GrpE